MANISFLFVITELFRTVLNKRLADYFEKCGPFPMISSMVSGLLSLFQIIW